MMRLGLLNHRFLDNIEPSTAMVRLRHQNVQVRCLQFEFDAWFSGTDHFLYVFKC